MESAEEVAAERLKCQLAYFSAASSAPRLEGSIVIRRVNADFMNEIWKCEKIISPPVIHSGPMEGHGNAIVDFANQYLHIGEIIPSATQEEVMFSVRPECFLGLMICEKMHCCDAIAIVGARQLSAYKGYMSTFQFDGIMDVPFHEACNEVVLAIDATMSGHYMKKARTRDVNKAAVGFALCRDILGEAVISTGGWGTGVFGHDHRIKFLEQLVAGAASGVKIEYSAYFQPKLEAMLKKLYEGVSRAAPRVCDLMKVLTESSNGSLAGFLEGLTKAGILERQKEAIGDS
jgi:hypothetical protein